MSIEKIKAEQAGLLFMDVPEKTQDMTDEGATRTSKRRKRKPHHIFELSSHKRAREAVEFGLQVQEGGYNIFVIGEDRSGRMTATLNYLKDYTKNLPKASDWVFVNNFRYAHRPKPFALPAETGQKFQDYMKKLVQTIRGIVSHLFEDPSYVEHVQKVSQQLESRMRQEIHRIQEMARDYGLDLHRGEDGTVMIVLSEELNQQGGLEALSAAKRKKVEEGMVQVRVALADLSVRAKQDAAEVGEQLQVLRQALVDEALAEPLDELERKYSGIPGLGRWFVELRTDILENIHLFAPSEEDQGFSEGMAPDPSVSPEERYGVNLFVEHSENGGHPIVVEPNPTYENIFGCIKYRAGSMGYETNVHQIYAGSLHKANGGILIIRADAIAQYAHVWEALKAALRDGEIRIEEMHRAHGIPMLEAPEPYPMPLNVKILLVGAPRWYSTFFFADSDFQSYFKVKAEIDSDLPATPENISIYCDLMQDSSEAICGLPVSHAAMKHLLGYSSRWAGHRKRLSARFELIEDVLAEAGTFAKLKKDKSIDTRHIIHVMQSRHDRDARIEQAQLDDIHEGQILIDTVGGCMGQVNGLTVMSIGNFSFGMPSRITARTFIGDQGIINIERMVDMGGPIQQKGVMELEGLLNGIFAQHFPLSLGCSLTFEQNYGGVEGDSASMAEFCAILSSLSEVPIRQDIAITGSVNQMGRSQAIGGVNEKIEGFFRTCVRRGLTGTQGAIIPRANLMGLLLETDVVEAIKKGQFHLWAVDHVDEALELLMDMPAGSIYDAPGTASVYARAYEKLAHFDTIMLAREQGKSIAPAKPLSVQPAMPRTHHKPPS